LDILLIATPPQHSTSNQAVILDANTLNEWVADLPVMNVIDTVSLLKKAITPFNELELEPSNRIKLLNIYHQAFEEILFSYDDLRLRSLPISPEERKVISEDIMWLYLGLANGYKIIVKEGHTEALNPKRDKNLLFAIYNAMELILNAIVYAYKAHEQAPPLAFLEIKQLYQYANFYSIQDKKIKGIKGHAYTPTINNIFKHFILFNTFDKDNYESSDILELFMLLESYTELCNIQSELPANKVTSCYLINFEDDNKAERIKDEQAISALQNYFIVDIQPAFTSISSRLNKLNEPKQSLLENKEKQLLNAFLENNNQQTCNETKKAAPDKKIKVITGLQSIIKILNDAELLNSILDIEVIVGMEVSNVSEDIATSISDWNLIDETDIIKILAGRIPTDDEILKTGDIVGLIETTNSNFTPIFLIGVIGKIKQTHDNNCKLGIEIIPGVAKPFMFTTASNLQAQGLSFPSIKALNLPASLLFKRSDITNDKTFQVIIDDKSYLVEIGTILLSTANYIQFAYTII